MGHIGRPKGKKVEELSVAPIYDWLEKQGLSSHLMSGKLKLLENLRFEEGENKCDPEYAKELAGLGEVYINEAFAAHHPAASTTILPTLLPAFAGLHFAREVEKLTKVRQAPRPGLVAIIGGVKAEDKLPAVLALSKIADYVLVGGKIVEELATRGSDANRGPVGLYPRPMSSLDAAGTRRGAPAPATPNNPSAPLSENITLASLNAEKTDITPETVEKWGPIIKKAKMIVWNGPLGKVEEPKNFRTHEIANLIISSGAESIIGGGDTISYLGKLGLLGKFGFISTGGGAMLEFLIRGTLPTIEALL
ncbi:MAG: Phosphoglycerate kinase [Candidatus Daviesbacteria bacterium GW2011_GWB1_41_5]|uniref:Phosphoglycerate kinase n=2 Tax=Candidatus Daviesiibacteriota TaxID=1752718 RepID=A0A0G0WL95_9BACT|nr:MAG: Phosphoglycerate kinase [Candidatus Daviesbacteria bacterium GW2011_GWB1_41_5]